MNLKKLFNECNLNPGENIQPLLLECLHAWSYPSPITQKLVQSETLAPIARHPLKLSCESVMV